MMCAILLKPRSEQHHGRLYEFSERCFDAVLGGYERSLSWVLRHQLPVLLLTLATVGLTVYLYIIIPKGFFPQQDTGRLTGTIIGDQNTSFQAMSQLVRRFAVEVGKDPSVDTVIAFEGGGSAINTGRMFVTASRRSRPICKQTADQVIAQLRGKLSHIPGATLYLQSVQDLRVGGRASAAQYQYTLQDDDLDELNHWAPLLLAKFSHLPGLVDVNTDQQDHGLAAPFIVNRDTASRFGITAATVDGTLYDAFGQRGSLHHVYAAQPIFRGHGGCSAILAKPRQHEIRLRALHNRASRCHSLPSRITRRRPLRSR